MSWLVVAKILPPFLHGEVPSTGVATNEPVCWEVLAGQQHLGWAVSQLVPGDSGSSEIHSRVVIDQIPFDKLAPRWMVSLVEDLGAIKLDMRSRTTLDAAGDLAFFDTRVKVNNLTTPIVMRGRVSGSKLKLRLQYGDSVQRMNYPWDKNAMLGSELTPDAKLLQMYVGRKWQKEVYNPFGGRQGAIELIEAEVVEEIPLFLNNEQVTTRRVEYRTLASGGVSNSNRRRATLWVAEDGNVLRQEIALMDLILRFERVPADEGVELADRLLELDRYATLSQAGEKPHNQEPGEANSGE